MGGEITGAGLLLGAEEPELPALGEDTAHSGYVEVGGGGGASLGEVCAECGHLGVADLVPRECPEGMPSGGEGLGDSAEDAADGLAGVWGESCEVKGGGMIGQALCSAFGSGGRWRDGEPLDVRRFPSVRRQHDQSVVRWKLTLSWNLVRFRTFFHAGILPHCRKILRLGWHLLSSHQCRSTVGRPGSASARQAKPCHSEEHQKFP